MCGICGFFSKSPLKFDDIIVKMNSAILHRGPNSSGFWLDENTGIALGHQRLSIIDLSANGSQPMKSSSSRFILVYNGEIYNHMDLRKNLDKINYGHKWRGNSDTETLLEALETWGIESTLKKLAGMFAFALWDKKNLCLTLARDRMGEKPLYFGWQGSGNRAVFLFGSEIKALKCHPDFIGDINRDSIALQLRHNCIPAPYSIYKGIHKLLPGHFLQLKENHFKNSSLPSSRPYWSLANVAVFGEKNQFIGNTENIINELEHILQQSIKQQMIADVPFGAFLSGGIDSSTIVALMQKHSISPIKTFTIGFNEDNYNEAKYAKAVAKHLRTDHTELYVSAEHAMSVIPKLPSLYDEPFSDSSQIPTYLVSDLAKKNVAISLSGDGGDELFCGYNRYKISNIWSSKLRLIPFFLRKFAAAGITSLSPNHWNQLSKWIPGLGSYNNFGDKMYKVANVLNSQTLSELYFRLVSQCQKPTDIVLNSKEPGTFLTNYKPSFSSLDDIQQMMVLDSLTYLPDDILVKIDRAAMGVSLETRIPFLDHRVVEFAWKIPQSFKLRECQNKWILRQVLYKYVPKELIERPKTGFGIPIDIWLRGPLREWAESLLNESRLRQEGFLNPNLVRSKWTEHLSGKKNWQYHLWDILMFQAWLEKN
jgi:asparagine synthase (glutamine-hydrolysing)